MRDVVPMWRIVSLPRAAKLASVGNVQRGEAANWGGPGGDQPTRGQIT